MTIALSSRPLDDRRDLLNWHNQGISHDARDDQACYRMAINYIKKADHVMIQPYIL